MVKIITIAQLTRAVKTAPSRVETEGKKFLQRGLSEYKRVAVQSSPWRVGQHGGGIPRDTGNLREQHQTKISGLRGTFGVDDQDVPYAKYVHGRRRGEINKRNGVQSRPWLLYAKNRADGKVEQHYKTFLDNVLNHIAT